MKNKINPREGSVTFWTNENKFDFSNKETTYELISVPMDGGSITIRKEGHFMVFEHTHQENSIRVAAETRNLNPEDKHFFAITWDLKKGKIVFYIDGLEKANNILHSLINS